jgi:spermidine synthase
MEYLTEISESDACTSYPVTEVVWRGPTPTCETVTVADSPAYGRMLFLDGELQSASADEHIYHESLVHPAMAVAKAKRLHGADDMCVLVVGGGEGATVREVLRWRNVAVVDWVDIDRELVDLCKDKLGWASDVYEDSRVRYYGEDIREAWVHLDQYDVIILDLPDPDGDTGYLYSAEFWADVRAHMTALGVCVTHVGPVRPYGGVGAGAQRIAAAGLPLHADGFYQICIPSFQGSWGFWMFSASGSDPFRHLRGFSSVLPLDLKCVDGLQLQAWAHSTTMWRAAAQGLLTDFQKSTSRTH